MFFLQLNFVTCGNIFEILIREKKLTFFCLCEIFVANYSARKHINLIIYRVLTNSCYKVSGNVKSAVRNIFCQ